MTAYLKFAEKSEAEYYEDEQQKDNGTYGLRNACDGQKNQRQQPGRRPVPVKRQAHPKKTAPGQRQI